MTIIELEGIDPKHLKRMRPDFTGDSDKILQKSKFSTMNCEFENLEKTSKRGQLSSDTPKKQPQESSQKTKGFMEDSIKKLPKIAQEQEFLKRERSKRKMEQEAPIGASCFIHCSRPLDSCMNTISPSREHLSGIHHIEPLVDRLDVCDCPNHARRSLSSCRYSKRKSQPLQDVVEKEELEES